MAITDSQKVDLLFKKVGYGVAKTDTSTNKSPANEANASPMVSPGSTIYQQDYYIQSVTTLPASNSSVVTIHRDSLSSTVQCAKLPTTTANVSWTTGYTDWVPVQYGTGYQVKLYAGPSGSSTPQNYTNLPADGSGNNDSWYFDYQSGIVNFADTNVPTAAGTGGNVVYVVGARYTGIKGIGSFANITVGNINITGNVTSGNVTANIFSSNISGTSGYFANATVTSNLFVSGTSLFTGNMTAGNITVTGNINLVSGNVNTITITGNSGQFFGNASGFGALYAGIPTGFVVQPQTIIQASSNFNGYAQINMQNINSGSTASSDFIATADNGNANDTYVDVGIASSTYNYPGFGAIRPNDGYLLVTGNATTGGGNVNIIAGSSPNDVVFYAGGANANNEIMRITHANVVKVSSTVASTNSTTGAVTIAGGLGVVGNINAGGNATVGNIAVSAIGTVTGNLITDVISPSVTPAVTFAGTTALRLPTGGTVARPTGISGYLRYNSDIATIEYYNGASWIPFNNVIVDQQITPDGISNSFTLTQASTAAGIIVSINGTLQQPGVAYTVTGTTITFAEVPNTSDLIDLRFIASAGVTSLDYAVVDTANIAVGTSNVILDSFSSSLYRSAKYIVSSTNSTDSSMAEVMLLQRGGVTVVNTYSNLNTGSNSITFYANSSGSVVNLLAQGTTSGNQLRIQRTYFNI